MTYGLLSALAWGISTLLAAIAARRIGALRTVVIGEAAGLVCYGVLFWTGHFSLRGIGGVAWLLVLAGIIGVAGCNAITRGSGVRARGPGQRDLRLLRRRDRRAVGGASCCEA